MNAASVIVPGDASSQSLRSIARSDSFAAATNSFRLLIPFAGEMTVTFGTTPNTEFLKGFLPLDEKGFIQTTPDLETPVPGVFAAGDVRADGKADVRVSVARNVVVFDSALAGLRAFGSAHRRPVEAYRSRPRNWRGITGTAPCFDRPKYLAAPTRAHAG